MQKGGGSLLHGFSELSRELSTPFLLDSSLSGPVFILLGTPFMSLLMKEAVDDWITDAKDGPSVGRHGLVTNVDHSYFRQGNLLASCAWSHVMEAWKLGSSIILLGGPSKCRAPSSSLPTTFQ